MFYGLHAEGGNPSLMKKIAPGFPPSAYLKPFRAYN